MDEMLMKSKEKVEKEKPRECLYFKNRYCWAKTESKPCIECILAYLIYLTTPNEPKRRPLYPDEVI